MRQTIYVLAVGASSLLLASCSGCDSMVMESPQLKVAVDVCAKPDINGLGGVEDCTVEFGATDVSTRVVKEIRISNVSEQELLIDSGVLSGSSDPAFTLEHVPSRLQPGGTAKMTVSFGPMLVNEVSGDIVLQTNADNAKNPEAGQLTIHLHGVGVDNGLPALKVEVLDQEQDACCDLGLVPIGSASNCRIRLTNVGTRDLVLQEAALVASATDGPWVTVGALPTDPMDHSDDAHFTIAPGESSALTVRFKPEDMVPHHARMLLRTNAPRNCGAVGEFVGNSCQRLESAPECAEEQRGMVTVDLRGQGIEAPVCMAGIKSVNGNTVFDPRQIEPLDNVELTAEASTTANPALTIASYQWTITRRPAGSNVRLDNPTSATPRFVFDNTSERLIVGLDVAGEYEVTCKVTDSRGTTSQNGSGATVLISAIPSEAIHLQLVWDLDGSDVDLHLIREQPAGQFAFNDSTDDCYYSNCKPTHDGPVWDDADPPHVGGNPVLDVDDTEGYGPENINVKEPLAGRYKALVYYFSDKDQGPTLATVRVYLYGNLIAEYQKMISDRQKWDIGIVDWPATGGASWTGIDQIVR